MTAIVTDANKPEAKPAAQRLKDMGFRKCGQWELHNDCIQCALMDHAKAKNVLYAFVIGEEVLYVGKTVGSLAKRMYNYQKPGPSQSTNIRCNKLIRMTLCRGTTVEIHALPDNGLLYYGGFHVNLAAGLEDSLIADLKPKWNQAGILSPNRAT